MLKKPTIKDVAKLAGVSTATVSFVLNNNSFQTISESTRQKVQQAALQLGYTPSAIAKSMRSKLSRAIAVVSYFSITEGHFNEVLLGIYGACEKKEYAVIISSVGDNPYEYAKLYKNGRIDGVIIICPYDTGVEFDQEENERLINELGIPAVFINSSKNHDEQALGKIRHIKFDYFSCGYSAAASLADAGHRSICYIEQDDDDYDKMPLQSAEIFSGVKACLEFIGAEVCDKRVKLSELDLVLEEKNSWAFVANNLACSAKLYRICADKHIKIGEDVSVICATYSSGAEYLYPEIVCARLPFYTIGTLGAHDIFDLIAGNSRMDGYLMPCSITNGNSVLRIKE